MNRKGVRRCRSQISELGSRNESVVQVGAWVEPALSAQSQNATLAAREEHEKIMRYQEEKEEKLRKFQKEVRRRVKAIEKIKQQKQLEDSYKAAEIQQKIVSQTAKTSQKLTHTKYFSHDSKFQQPRSPVGVSVMEEEAKDISAADLGRRSYRYAKSPEGNQQEHRTPTVLAGGIWHQSPSRHQLSVPLDSQNDEDDFVTTFGPTLLDEEIDANIHQHPLREREGVSTAAPFVTGTGPSKEVVRAGSGKAVRFSDNAELRRTDRDAGVEDRRQYSYPVSRVPDIRPGVQEVENQKQARNQFSMYRRLFMDNEREQVKENVRLREHEKKMKKLINDREEKRLNEEKRLLMKPTILYMGDSEERKGQVIRHFDHPNEETVQEIKRQHQKSIEAKRYQTALKILSREKSKPFC